MGRFQYFKFEAKVGDAPLRIAIERRCRFIRFSGPAHGKVGEKEAQVFLRALEKFGRRRGGVNTFESGLRGINAYRGRAGKEKIRSITLDLQ